MSQSGTHSTARGRAKTSIGVGRTSRKPRDRQTLKPYVGFLSLSAARAGTSGRSELGREFGAGRERLIGGEAGDVRSPRCRSPTPPIGYATRSDHCSRRIKATKRVELTRNASKAGARARSSRANPLRTSALMPRSNARSAPSSRARSRVTRTCRASSALILDKSTIKRLSNTRSSAHARTRVITRQTQASSAATRAKCTVGSRLSSRRKNPRVALSPRATDGSTELKVASALSCRSSSLMSVLSGQRASESSPGDNRRAIRLKAAAADCSPARNSAN